MSAVDLFVKVSRSQNLLAFDAIARALLEFGQEVVVDGACDPKLGRSNSGSASADLWRRLGERLAEVGDTARQGLFPRPRPKLCFRWCRRRLRRVYLPFTRQWQKL